MRRGVVEYVDDTSPHYRKPDIALTMDGEDFVPVDFEGQYYFSRIPVLNIPFGQYVDASPLAVAGALAGSNTAIIRGHGIFACGETLDQAYKWSSSVEFSARIAWLQRQRGSNTHEDRG